MNKTEIIETVSLIKKIYFIKEALYIGCGQGLDLDIFLKNKIQKVTLVDANIEQLNKLLKFNKLPKNYITQNKLIWKDEKSIKFHIASNPDISSVYPIEKYKKLMPNIKNEKILTFDSCSLNSFLIKNNIHANLLYIDIFDSYEFLLNNEHCLTKFEVVIVRVLKEELKSIKHIFTQYNYIKILNLKHLNRNISTIIFCKNNKKIINKLNDSILELDSNKVNIEQKFKILKTKLEKLINEKDNKIEDLNKLIGIKEKRINDYENSINKREEQLKQKENDYNKQIQEIESNYKNKLEKNQKEFIDKIDKLEEIVNEKSNKIEDLKRLIEEKEKTINNYKSSINKIEEELNQKENDYNKQIQEIESKYKNKLEKNQKELSDKVSQIEKKIETDKNLLKQHINSIVNKVSMNNAKQIESFISIQNYLINNIKPINFHGWPISPDLGLFLINLIENNNYDLIIEFGSGTSTILFGEILKKQSKEIRQITFEHNEKYYKQTYNNLLKRDIKDIELVLSPLVGYEYNKNMYKYYDCDKKIDELLKNDKIKNILVFVDGPPGNTCHLARFPAIPKLSKLFSNKEIDIVLDDYKREEEKEIVKLWEKFFSENNISFQAESIESEKGLYYCKTSKILKEKS